MSDLADDGLIGLDRAILADKPAQGLHFGREGFYYAARRLLLRAGAASGEAGFDETIAQLRAVYAGDARVAPALEQLAAAEAEAGQGRDFGRYRESLAAFIDLAAELAGRAYEAPAFDAAALGDSSGAVAAMLRAQGVAE